MFDNFRPLPMLGNRHVQTLLGSWLHADDFPLESQEHHVHLPDGDLLVLHDSIPNRWLPGDRTVLLVHGLGGSHRSPHLLRLARRLMRRGLRVFRMDLRGCGKGIALARRSYHGGISDDVRAAAAAIHRLSPGSPLALIGISLGGNIVLKLAGESAANPVPNLERVAAIAPPIDLMRCAQMLRQPHNRLYEKHFLGALLNLYRRRRQYFPDLPAIRFPRQLTMQQYDELHTAPHWGFRSVEDYYQQASSLPVIPHIPVPTLILTAKDDPFIAVEPFEQLNVGQHVETYILPHGGHLGFLGWDGDGGIRWAERRVADWLTRAAPATPMQNGADRQPAEK